MLKVLLETRKFFFVIFLSLLIVSCGSTRKKLKLIELNSLKARFNKLQEVNDYITQNPNPEITSDFSFFISLEKINEILSGADGFRKEISAIPGAFIQIDSIRVRFDYGLPNVDINAWAGKTNSKCRVDLRMSAFIEIKSAANDPHKAIIKFHLEGVCPIAKWNFLRFKFRGFVKDLIKLKLNEYLSSLPGLSFPLKSEVPINILDRVQQLDFSIGDQRIIGDLKIPGVEGKKTLYIKRALFHSDGVHVLFSFR
jgi:hypothetical protein